MLHNLVSNYVTISTKHLLNETHVTRCFNSSENLHTHSLVGEIGISLIVVPVIKDTEDEIFRLPKIETTESSQNHITITRNSQTWTKIVAGVIIFVIIVNVFFLH
jgi:hypothetical protein